MIYELRTYTARPGKHEALVRRFGQHTMPIFARLGIEVVHCWTRPDAPDDFCYLTRFESEAQKQQALQAFAADEEWKRVKAASETDGPLLASQTVLALNPVDFSPADRA
ncbi:hypothetical protein GCM10023144_16510 [Pigmentiphaga soli]|uniref:NIPSNAP domain-containing protein n=1 Tax=Pigmentiphaga soli TaxID=1007095 RepID=A0ABP8GT21_9BURK